MSTTSVRLSGAVWQAAKLRAVREGTTMQAVVEAAVRAWLEPGPVQAPHAPRSPQISTAAAPHFSTERAVDEGEGSGLVYDRSESQERWGRR